MTDARRHRIGLVGCGEVASYGHLPALLANERVDVVGVCDVSPERLAAAPVPEGTARVARLDELPELDALVVTSPAGVHAENVAWAAGRGLPVLCEKPLSTDEAGAVAMVETMEAAGAPLWVGFTYRFSPVATRIAELIGAGAVGEVKQLRMVYLWDLHGAFADREARTGTNARRDGRLAEGGPLVDCGVHQIDLARWWLGAELEVEQATGIWFDDVEAPGHVVAQLAGGGASVMVDISVAYGHRAARSLPTYTYEVVGTEGVIRYRREERDFVLMAASGVHELEWAPEKSFDGMVANLVAALDGEPHALPSGRDGVAATRLALAATERASAGR